jgi:hypothetical protein
MAVVAIGIHCRRRHRVDRIHADQFVDIENIAVGLVLGSGARPQQALGLGALLRQTLPALVRVYSLVELIGEFGVGDCDFALQPLQLGLLGRVGGRGNLFVELIINQSIDAADEKTRHARHLVRVAALFGESLEPGNVSLGNLGVDLLREQQGHVDVDPLADQGADGRQTRLGAGHLDHQVAAVNLMPQPARFLDRLVRVHRQVGRDFEADKAVAPLGLLIDAVQCVGAFLDIANREILEQRAGIEIPGGFGLGDQGVVVIAVTDRLLENRRVRGDAAQTVLGDQPGQSSAFQQITADKVQPYRLAEFVERP